MPRGRPCKYGERTASGKCPPKPKAATLVPKAATLVPKAATKKRPCKYGERTASGKCPPKPRNTTRKRRTRKPAKIPLSIEDKQYLAKYIYDAYGNHPRASDALAMLENAQYDPSYISPFRGESYEGKEDKEYFQVQDKIDAFFKYGDTF